MADSKWKIIFTSQALLILIIGGVISSRMGIFDEIRHDVFLDVNAETVSMNNTLKVSKNSDTSKVATKEVVSKNTVKPKEDTKKELVQKASIAVSGVDNASEEARIFNKKTEEDVKKIEEKFKDQIKDSFITITTSYNSEVGQTDDTPCVAAKGMDLCKRGVEDIVATNDLPIHTKLMIPEYFGEQIFYVEDRMNARYTGTDHVDIWFKKKIDSKAWGAKIVKILIIK